MFLAFWPPLAHRYRVAAYTASTGSYGLGGTAPPGGTGSAYAAKLPGSICIGPSAPLKFAPECTPGAVLCPFADSTVPTAATTVHGSPGQVAAACWYSPR